DPGFSQFYVSLQDEIVRQNGLIDTEKYADGKHSISKAKLKKVINTAQKTGEEFSVMSRKNAMDYDQVMQRQRALIYATRDHLLDGEVMDFERIKKLAKENIKEFLESQEEYTVECLNRYILDNISYRLEEEINPEYLSDPNKITKYLLGIVRKGLKEQEGKLEDSELMTDFLRIATLQAIDDAWVEQVDYLQQLQVAVSGRASAQRNLVYEYQRDALESFRKMEKDIKKNIIRNILLSNVYVSAEDKISILLP
ncbi:MAG: accessory Sec system translocase SecA2, partial [Agathobacter sp.]|nr:accessory Sec system translocase SecA2 [Agathobacter sp.]